MLNQPTIEKLHTMKLHGMGDAFRAQIETADASQLGFEERFAMLVDQQWLWKENRALARRLHSARLKERGVIEDIDYQHPRGLDRKLLRTLSASEWVRQNQNVLFIGPTGIGKSWLSCALAQKACRDGFSVMHKRTTELFRELAVAHVDGSIGRVFLKLSRVDVLVLDDFAMAPLKDTERRDFWRSAMTAISAVPSSLLLRYRSRTGMNRSVTLPLPTASSTGWYIMLSVSNSAANRCERSEAKHRKIPSRSPGLSSAGWGKGPQTPTPCPRPHSPLKNRKSLTDVNILRHHANTSVASLRPYSHRVGTDHPHRRNPHLNR